MSRLLSTFLLLAICWNNCVPQGNISKITIPIVDISTGFENNKTINLSQIAKSISYIPLETTNDSYISTVTQAEFTDRQIIIFDGKSNKLLRFDLKGHFLGTIGRLGKGPGEYVRITKIEVNQSNKTIYVFDFALGEILKFNFEGQFIGNNRNPLLGYWVTMIDDKYFVYFDAARSYKFAGGYYKSIVTDLDGKILRKFLLQNKSKEEKFKSPCSMQSAVFNYENAAHFWEVTSDTVFKVTPDLTFSYCAFIEQGPNSLPKKEMYNADFVIKRFNEYSTIIWLLETEKYYFGRGITNSHLASILYFKNSKEVYNVSNNRKYMVNDLDHGPNFWPIGKINDHLLYSAVDLTDFKDLIADKSNQDFKYSQHLIDITKNTKDIDNPALIILELK